jgi:type IV secretory pathway VirB10-like protein
MRTKVLLSVVVLAVLILVPAVYFHNAATSPPSTETTAAPVAQQDTPAAAARPSQRPLLPARAPQPPPSIQPLAADVGAPGHQEYVTQRKAELLQMGMTDDPAALKTILSELNNQDPEIRKTALTATIDFGGKDAIPVLKNQLDLTDDFREKMEIQKAIDFLELPPARPQGAPISQQSDTPAPPTSN